MKKYGVSQEWQAEIAALGFVSEEMLSSFGDDRREVYENFRSVLALDCVGNAAEAIKLLTVQKACKAAAEADQERLRKAAVHLTVVP